MKTIELAEMATKVINLSNTLSTTFDKDSAIELTAKQQEHLKLAIMAGLKDAYTKGEVDGYSRAYTEVKRLDVYAPNIIPPNPTLNPNNSLVDVYSLPVSRYDRDGILVDSFTSIYRASEFTGEDKKVIVERCNNPYAKSKYYWNFTSKNKN